MSELTYDERRVRALFDRVHSTRTATPAGLEPLFEEIRGTLRVPFVGTFFRFLALDPVLLRSVWQGIGATLATEQADREVERLYQHALFVAPSLDLGAQHRAWLHGRGLDAGQLACIVAVNQSVQYAAARMLLAAAAVAGVLEREAAGGAAPPPPVPLPLKPRALAVAPGAVKPEPVELDGRNPILERRLDALAVAHGHPVVAGYYRALAGWPAYLERAEMDLMTIVGSLRYRACAELLATVAEVSVRPLVAPFPLETGEQLTRADLAVLVTFFHRRLLPDLLIDTTFLRALDDDARKARTVPF